MREILFIRKSYIVNRKLASAFQAVRLGEADGFFVAVDGDDQGQADGGFGGGNGD